MIIIKTGETIDKAPVIPYSYFIAFASEKGHAFGGQRGHKSGQVSLPRFYIPSFAGGDQTKTGPGYV